ncbi:MAG: protein kinase [Polyangiaceae bacterium]|nr:protein kinase [Polyangiaceae bacterium]
MAKPLAGGDPSQSAAAKERAAALVGRTISDRYRIVKLLAMGGMGAIYKAEHLLMRKAVAIKVLHPETENFPELVARFEREAIAGAHIVHPNVASASDFGKFDGGSYFLVLEFIEGFTLSDLIKEGPVAPLRAARLIRQLAAAVGAAHQKDVVHRDMKPKNVMICEPTILDTAARGGEDEIVKLIDFGLAKVPVDQLSTAARDPDAESRDLTNAGVVMGTIAYMAPETALGMRAVQARADLYSIGVILYEMLAGKHMFDAVDPQKLFAAHCSLKPPPIRERNPSVNVPASLESIVMRLLEKDPGDRYPDADALIVALDAFKMQMKHEAGIARPAFRAISSNVGGELTPLPSAASGPHAVSKVPERRSPLSGPLPWIAGALGVVLLVGGLAFALSGGSDNEDDKKEVTGASATPTPPGTSKPQAPVTAAKIASAAPTPTTTPGELDAKALRDAMNSGPANAGATLLNLVRTKADAFREPTVQSAAAAAAEKVADADLPETEEIFEHFASKLGQPGIDVLYELTLLPDTSKAAARAHALLAKPEVIATGSAPMKIAYELKKATCSQRTFLFPRAAQEGDDRTLVLLSSMLPPACEPRSSPCCFLKHGELEKAVADIRTRLRR